MVSIPKAVGILSCGFLLCLGLSNAAQADDAAADKQKADQSDLPHSRTLWSDTNSDDGTEWMFSEQPRRGDLL
jgi:hypothetical protein